MPLNVPESRQNSCQKPKTPGIARLSPPACPGGGPTGPRTFAPFPLISSGPARIPGRAGIWPWRAILPGYRPGGRALTWRSHSSMMTRVRETRSRTSKPNPLANRDCCTITPWPIEMAAQSPPGHTQTHLQPRTIIARADKRDDEHRKEAPTPNQYRSLRATHSQAPAHSSPAPSSASRTEKSRLEM